MFLSVQILRKVIPTLKLKLKLAISIDLNLSGYLEKGFKIKKWMTTGLKISARHENKNSVNSYNLDQPVMKYNIKTTRKFS